MVMSDFIGKVSKLLIKRWNTPEFQFRLERFVKTKRDREILSHFHGWSGAHPDGTLTEWVNALSSDPRLKNKAIIAEDALKDALIQTGCAYPDMNTREQNELQNADRLFGYLLASVKKMLEVEGKISASSVTPASAPTLSVQEVLSSAFQRKLRELEEERDRLTALANSGGDLTEKLGNKQTDLKVAKQECAKLESQVKSAQNEIKGNITTDIEDVEKAHNKMGEYKKLIGQRDDALGMVGGLEREISVLKRAIEEQKKESRKDIAVKQQDLSRDIDILVKSADILGMLLEDKPIKAKQEVKPKNGAPRRSQRFSSSFSQPTPQTPPPSSSQFTLSEDQRQRINALSDGVWYGTKRGFGHAGVIRTASQDPTFKTNADFLQAMIDFTYKQKADKLPGSTERGLSKCIPAVRNRIASFPIWDGIWADGGAVNPDAIEAFIQSKEQAAQPQAS